MTTHLPPPNKLRRECDRSTFEIVARKYGVGLDEIVSILADWEGDKPTDWQAKIDLFESQGMSYGEAVNKVLAAWTDAKVSSDAAGIEPRYFRRMDGRAMR